MEGEGAFPRLPGVIMAVVMAAQSEFAVSICPHFTQDLLETFSFLLPASLLEGRRFRESPESPRNLPEIIGQAST